MSDGIRCQEVLEVMLTRREAYGYREKVIHMLQSKPGASVQKTNQFRISTVYTIHPEQLSMVAANGSGFSSCNTCSGRLTGMDPQMAQRR